MYLIETLPKRLAARIFDRLFAIPHDNRHLFHAEAS